MTRFVTITLPEANAKRLHECAVIDMEAHDDPDDPNRQIIDNNERILRDVVNGEPPAGPHTPGPWQVDTAGWPLIINGPDDAEGRNFVCQIEADGVLGGSSNSYDEETAKANASLIASAPALLAALVRLEQQITARGLYTQLAYAVDDARTAIAASKVQP